MVDNVIDRGGDIGPADSMPADGPDSPVRKSRSSTFALLAAGVALCGTMGGIAIGYGTFHHSAPTKPAGEPAKASDRAVDDVMANPNAQRAALASQLGQPNAPQVDVLGRPVQPSPSTTAAGTVQPGQAGTGATMAGGAGTPTSGTAMTPEQQRANQARTLADAARRSPIMAFGATPMNGLLGQSPTPGQSPEAGETQEAGQPQNFGASGFGPPVKDGSAASGKGTTDLSGQLAHSSIETVRATMVADRNLLLSAGTIIPCTLQTAINSTQAGFVSCVINHDVYSENGRVVLLDKGTKVLGQYSGGITQGQARLFVLWTRALTPRGVAIDLGSPAADSLGRAGMAGGVDTQFWAKFGAALLMSVLEDASNIASRAVAGQGTYTTQVPGNMGETILQSTANIRPILKKNQGDTASIFVAKDFDFRSVYELGLRR